MTMTRAAWTWAVLAVAGVVGLVAGLGWDERARKFGEPGVLEQALVGEVPEVASSYATIRSTGNVVEATCTLDLLSADALPVVSVGGVVVTVDGDAEGRLVLLAGDTACSAEPLEPMLTVTPPARVLVRIRRGGEVLCGGVARRVDVPAVDGPWSLQIRASRPEPIDADETALRVSSLVCDGDPVDMTTLAPEWGETKGAAPALDVTREEIRFGWRTARPQ